MILVCETLFHPKSIAYRHCVEIMRFLVEAGFTYQVHDEALKVAITAVRGGDPRTLKNWTQTLERLDFIKKVNPHVYQMNLESIPELLNIVVKSGQKKLM